MAANAESGNSSSVGSILGGLAAVIAAVATLIGVIYNSKNPSEHPSKPDETTMSKPKSPPSPTDSTEQKTPVQPTSRKIPQSRSAVATVDEPLHAQPTESATKVPFDIEGTWSGRTGQGPAGYELYVITGPAPSSDGRLTVNGNVSAKCVPFSSWNKTVDGYWQADEASSSGSLLVSPSGSQQSSYPVFMLSRKGSTLKGTVDTGEVHGIIDRKPIILHKEKLSCQGS